MWVYIILIIIIAGLLIFTEIGRAILKILIWLVIIIGLVYFGDLVLKFFMDQAAKI